VLVDYLEALAVEGLSDQACLGALEVALRPVGRCVGEALFESPDRRSTFPAFKGQGGDSFGALRPRGARATVDELS